MILGQSVESFNHEIGDLFSKAFNKASLITATRVRLGDLYFLYAPKGFFTACKTVKSYTEEFVKDALQQDRGSGKISDRYTFINELQNEHQGVHLVRDQAINVLIADRDTIPQLQRCLMFCKFCSSCIAGIMAEYWTYSRLLVRYPHVLKKLRVEVESVLGQDTNVTRAYIQRMPYLQHVIKESK